MDEELCVIPFRLELEDSTEDILRPRDPLDIGSHEDDVVGEKLSQPIVHCIFSARFDEADGPCIEWKYPDSFDVDGLEFSALASGLHNKSGPDVIYFKKGIMFGVACYRRHLKNGRGSRDAVMRSVGVITEHYGFLQKHTSTLIRIAEEETIAQLSEKSKEEMMDYWRQNQIDTLDSSHTPNPSLSWSLPLDSFSDLFAALGENVFTLWKAALLRKRILFILDPPLKQQCMFVYATAFLARHQIKQLARKIPQSNPLFYVNVMQTRPLMDLREYVACTTERIFENKTHLFDVVVSSHLDDKSRISVQVVDSRLAQATAVTAGDILKYQYLIKKFQAQDQNMLVSFFQDMNNRLLSGLWNRRTHDAPVAPAELPNFGLHGTDIQFFTALVDAVGLDIGVERMWCGCCS